MVNGGKQKNLLVKPMPLPLRVSLVKNSSEMTKYLWITVVQVMTGIENILAKMGY
jgi:hypothetical protein